MAQRITATRTPPAPPAAADHGGAVLSIEHARRRRSRAPVPDGVIRVLVVGSHALTRAGLRRLLEDEPGLAVVGEAASGCEAAALARWTDPDVALLDAGCLQPDPADFTHALGGRIAVLLLTDCEADDRLLAALRAGARGVLPKHSHPAELASAVRTVAGGGALLPPLTTRRLITELVNTTPATRR
jgi:DNA-binding NarL/FixJ family response regulator